jgi:hypothetical protein
MNLHEGVKGNLEKMWTKREEEPLERTVLSKG